MQQIGQNIESGLDENDYCIRNELKYDLYDLTEILPVEDVEIIIKRMVRYLL